jgi:hypothetical protein
MKYTGWVFGLLVIALTIGAQNPGEQRTRDLTWNELKAVQAQERKEAQQAQKDTLTAILGQQKAELEAVKSTGNSQPSDVKELSKMASDERKALAQIQSEERNKLAEIQSAERKHYQELSGKQTQK